MVLWQDGELSTLRCCRAYKLDSLAEINFWLQGLINISKWLELLSDGSECRKR